MNVNMYNNPRTKHNMKVLSQDGYYFIEPGSGYLACGYVAKGRMEEPMQILSVINKFFTQQKNVVKSFFWKARISYSLQLKLLILFDTYQIVHQEKWDML